MKLIADIGATNSRWVLKSRENEKRFSAKGFNPSFDAPEILSDILRTLDIVKDNITDIHLYGAGLTPAKQEPVRTLLEEHFHQAKTIDLETDLLGTCRSLAKNQQALVGILGTGSNSCFYDGQKIKENIRSMGYLFGDEGSAYSIGRDIIKSFGRKEFDHDLEKEFMDKFNLTHKNLTKTLYASKQINVTVAQYAQFASAHIAHPVIQAIVTANLKNYIDLLKQYNQKELPLFMTGSIACIFQNNIQEILNASHMKQATFIEDILPGLVQYHI